MRLQLLSAVSQDERTLSDNKAVQTARNRLTPNTDGTLHSAQRINTAVADPVALLWSTTRTCI